MDAAALASVLAAAAVTSCDGSERRTEGTTKRLSGVSPGELVPEPTSARAGEFEAEPTGARAGEFEAESTGTRAGEFEADPGRWSLHVGQMTAFSIAQMCGN